MNAAAATRPTIATTREGDLRERIRREFFATGYPALRSIFVFVHEGLVTLRGNVPTWFEKQLAQAVVMRLDDVESLRNEIRVTV